MYHKKILRYFLLGCMIAGLVNLSGCAGTKRNLNVKEADENMVKNCQFLGTFESSFYDGSRAMNFAIDAAAKKGATHYIIMDTSTRQHKGELNSQTEVRIRGYRCSNNNSTSKVIKTENKKVVKPKGGKSK